jgi:drug/metabolite transporter (DMT)-like permease
MTRPAAVAAMLAAAVIYGSNFALSRHATLNGLTAHDLAALRFGVAGFLLLPFFLWRGPATCTGIGWGRGLALAVLSGAPMAVLMNTGLSLAPAAHGAALQPGLVTIFGVVGSALLFKVRPSPAAVVGIAVALGGLASIGLAGATSGSRSVMLGDLCFLFAGAMWGIYPLLLQRWGIGGVDSTIVVAVLSLLYVPFYVALFEPRIGSADPGLVLFQAFFQGVVSVIVGLWLWGSAVAALGAATAQRFPPLLPVVGTLAAVPILGEWPGPLQALGVALIVCGLMLAAFGDFLAARRRLRAGRLAAEAEPSTQP